MSADQTGPGLVVIAPVMAMAFKKHSGWLVDADAPATQSSTGDTFSSATKPVWLTDI